MSMRRLSGSLSWASRPPRAQPSTYHLNIPGFILHATHKGLPAMFEAPFWLERGGLASYGQI